MLVLLYGLVVFLALFLVITFAVSGLFNKSSSALVSWSSPYECGFCSNSLSFNSFSFTYFSLLVFFVVFDLEISLLLNLPEQGWLYNNFFFYFCFLCILALGFLVEVIMGYVRWGY